MEKSREFYKKGFQKPLKIRPRDSGGMRQKSKESMKWREERCTLLDIVKGKTRIEKCTAETIYKLAKTLDVPMESLSNRAAASCFYDDLVSP